jgi:urea transport system permease protein
MCTYKIFRTGIGLLALFMMMYSMPLLAEESSQDLSSAWAALIENNYAEKEQAITLIAESEHPRAPEILSALLDGRLYYSRKDDSLFFMSETEDGYRFEALKDGAVIEQGKKRGFRKIRINNQIRGLIRQLLASSQLKNKDAKIRLGAVEELLKEPDEDAAKLVAPLVESEPDQHVAQLMGALIAITELDGAEVETQAAAIETLKTVMAPAAINALRAYEAPNAELAEQAALAIKSIEQKRDLYAKVETIFFGLSLGSVLALAAIGLAITFGVMGVINMAHGELIMIGAYTTYVIQLMMPDHIGISIIVAIPAAFVVAGLVGIGIERIVIRHLYGRPLETLLATFGISLVLQQAVRSIFSPLNRTVETPSWMSGAWQVNDVLALTWNRIYIIFFCFAVFMALIAIMKRTPLGLQVRAVSQNRAMARAMGVRSEWVDALTFGLGSGIAGIAGVALSLLTNVGPNLGQSYIIDSFMVVVFGGVGNLWGTLVAGMSLGVVNKILEPWAGAVLAKIVVLVFIILFIQKYPKGLFPQRGRAAED